MWLPLVCACSSDTPEASSPDEEEPTPPLTIRASLPGNPGSRAQITYGNQDAEAGEYFLWDEGDEIFIYNISTLVETDEIYCFNLSSFEGQDAVFTLDTSGEFYPTEFHPKAGDVLVATFGEGSIYKNVVEEVDPRRIISLYVGTEQNKPQWVVKDPTNADLKYMQHNLKMYDIVTVEEDDVIPDLHFKHLSAIMRVTFRNNSSDPVYFTKIEFKYPDTDAFFNTTMYFGVEDNASDGYNLKIYNDNEFFNGSMPYTSSIGTTINGKDGTKDGGESVEPGDSYELYLSTVPRFNEVVTGNKLLISLIQNHDTDNPFTLTLDGFNVPIKAGYRYWFDVTLTPEGKLILTPPANS